MPNLVKGNRDTLPDHMTADGDPVAYGYRVCAWSLDKRVLCTLTIALHASNALSVYGHVGCRLEALSLLDHAEDSLRGYHTQTHKLVIMGNNVSMPLGEEVEVITLEGFGPSDPLQDKFHSLACLAQARQAIIDLHEKRRIIGGNNRARLE